MIETFESRQLFSVALDMTVAPMTNPGTEQPAVVFDAAAAKTAGGKVIVHDISFTHRLDTASAK